MADPGRLAGSRFLVIGRAGMDFYADPPGARIEGSGRFVACLGGSSANVAAGLARLGRRTALLGCVSDDAVGAFVLGQLDAYGIDRSLVRVVGGEARTSLAVVETRLDDCRAVIYRNGAADFALTPEDVGRADYAAFGAVAVAGTALAAEPSRGAVFRALDLARAAGAATVLDIDHRPYSWPSAQVAAEVVGRAASLCDIVVGNDVEFGVLAGDPALGRDAARALATGGRVCVYKMGEKGSVTFGPEGAFATGVFPTEALKPTGAGDAFLAGLLAALAEGTDLRAAVRAGSAAAAIVVGRVGCAPAMPTRAELAAFLAAHDGPEAA